VKERAVIRPLLQTLLDPRHEARFLRFLELSGVGRTVDGEDVEDGWAMRMEWMDRVGGEGEGGGIAALLCSFLLFLPFVQGIHTPSFVHSATMRRRISLRS